MLKTRTLTGMGLGLLALASALIGPGTTAQGQQGPGGYGSPFGYLGPWGGGGPTSRPATSRPVIKLDLKPADPAKQQAEALAKVIDVSYRRDFPIEVLQDLNQRTGLRYALPGPLDKAYLFTFEAKGVTVKEVLVRLALAGLEAKAVPAGQTPANAAADSAAPFTLGGGNLALKGDLAVLIRRADDKVLADLQKGLASDDRWERIHAIWGLANLADPRIYPPLLKMLADKDPGVVEWTLKGLEKHVLMVGLWPEADRNVLAEALLRWFDKADFSGAQNHFMLGWGSALGGQTPVSSTLQRMRLLAATRRPQAVAALAQYLTKGPKIGARCDVATVLGDFGQAQTELLALMKQSGTKWETYSKQQQEEQAKWWADHAEDKKQGKPLNFPPDLFSYDPAMHEQQRLYVATQRALIVAKNPDVLTAALTEYLYPTGQFGAGVYDLGQVLRETGEPQVLEQMIRPLLAQVEWFYGDDIPVWDASKNTAMGPRLTVARPPTARPVSDFFNADLALAALQQYHDPRAYRATARVAKNAAALKFITGTWNPPTLRATDPAVVEALLAYVKETGPMGLLVARSLASSRDVRAADALIAMLQSEDKELVGEVAMALANTHDFRTLKTLTNLLAQKIDWPDPEGAEMEKMQQGKAARTVINPRTLVVLGMLASRDPAAFEALLTLMNDPKADEEMNWLALSAQDAQAIEKLIAWVKKAEPANQQLVLLTGGMGNWMKQAGWQREGIRELPLRCREDGRWPGLVGARVSDDGVTVYRQDGVTPQRNWVMDMLAQIVTPDSELALLAISQGEDKDLAGFATKALKVYNDPGAVPPAKKP